MIAETDNTYPENCWEYKHQVGKFPYLMAMSYSLTTVKDNLLQEETSTKG